MRRRSKALIEQTLQQLDSDIAILFTREASLQRAIDDLSKLKADIMNERVEKEAKRKDLEAEKEPINWLPPELLSQIFAATIDLDFEGMNCHPPIILSHVCSKWRDLVLSNSYLWSRITLRGFKNSEIIDMFLLRSKDAWLDIAYASLSDSMATEEHSQARDFLHRIRRHLHRCKALSFQCKTAAAVAILQPLVQRFDTIFPNLQRFNLSISTPNPSFLEVPSLLLPHEDATDESTSPSTPSCLRHLILHQVPPKLPTEFIGNLRKVELSYSAGKHASQYRYYLKLSSLCRFLSLTPRLEELTLTNTVPYVDALPAPTQTVPVNPSSSGTLVYLPPTRLEHLRTIEWTYPSSLDVPRLLCLLDAPVLDKLDLWVEKPPLKRSHPNYRSPALQEYIHVTPCFPMLRDLSLQCNGDEAMVSVLRRFSLPAVERVAITNVDTAARKHAEGKEPQLILFPRLESIFHDPRLPHLTHLTLSHFKISPEAGRGESVLGYMPLLTSLSLDSCLGVGRLLEGLQEKLLIGTTSPKGNERPSKRGVKLCPRLEALSIWGCRDVDFGCLREVVLARNETTKDRPTQADGSDTGPNSAPHGTNTSNVMRYDIRQGSREGYQDGNPDSHKVLTERKIKPLKSNHPILCATAMSSSSQLDPKAKIVSTLVAMREVLEPANIIYIRVAQCKLVTKEQAFSLRDLGVIDVIWASSN